MRTDFENIADGARVLLQPKAGNAGFIKPTFATLIGDVFYADGSHAMGEPDCYLLGAADLYEGFDDAPAADGNPFALFDSDIAERLRALAEWHVAECAESGPLAVRTLNEAADLIEQMQKLLG